MGQTTEEVEEERQPLVPLQETSEQGLNTVHQGGGNSPDPSAHLSPEQVPGSAPWAPPAGAHGGLMTVGDCDYIPGIFLIKL